MSLSSKLRRPSHSALAPAVRAVGSAPTLHHGMSTVPTFSPQFIRRSFVPVHRFSTAADPAGDHSMIKFFESQMKYVYDEKSKNRCLLKSKTYGGVKSVTIPFISFFLGDLDEKLKNALHEYLEDRKTEDTRKKREEILYFKNSGKSGKIFFAHKEIARATNFFFKDNIIGSGGFSQVNHRSLVRLIGRCIELDQQPILVYEYVPNGTLSDIFTVVTAENGLQLVGVIGSELLTKQLKALLIFHSSAVQPIYHGDVKSSNILLDENFEPKLSDLGISKLVEDRETSTQGTPGYLDPDYLSNFQLPDKINVYIFGVVLLEL
ncbi:hypothetical protein EV1_032399 [Malus domestica]